jgi:hypothetical protein
VWQVYWDEDGGGSIESGNCSGEIFFEGRQHAEVIAEAIMEVLSTGETCRFLRPSDRTFMDVHPSKTVPGSLVLQRVSENGNWVCLSGEAARKVRDTLIKAILDGDIY